MRPCSKRRPGRRNHATLGSLFSPSLYLIREYDGDDEDVSQETHRQNDGAKDQRCCGDVLYAREASIQTYYVARDILNFSP